MDILDYGLTNKSLILNNMGNLLNCCLENIQRPPMHPIFRFVSQCYMVQAHSAHFFLHVLSLPWDTEARQRLRHPTFRRSGRRQLSSQALSRDGIQTGQPEGKRRETPHFSPLQRTKGQPVKTTTSTSYSTVQRTMPVYWEVDSCLRLHSCSLQPVT